MKYFRLLLILGYRRVIFLVVYLVICSSLLLLRGRFGCGEWSEWRLVY